MSDDYKLKFKSCIISMNEVTIVGGKPLLWIYSIEMDHLIELSYIEMIELHKELTKCLEGAK